MFRRCLFIVALVLAATALAAQTGESKGQGPKPVAAQGTTGQYVPAVLQQRMTRLSGCLQQKEDYILTDARLSQEGDVAQGKQDADASVPSTYKLEGISSARLSVLVGKRVDVTGAFQGDPKLPPADGSLARFEATNITEASETCSAPASADGSS